MARARKARRIPEWMIGVAITLVVLVMGFMRPSFLETFEYQLFDLRLKWFGAHAAPQNIAIVAIDEESITKVGRWPWPRSRITALVDQLTAKGAKVIGLSLILSEPEEQSSLAVLQKVEESFRALGTVKGGDGFLQTLQEIRTSLDNDSKLAGALQKADRVLLPGFGNLEGAQGATPTGKAEGVSAFAAKSAFTNLSIPGDQSGALVPRASEMTWPLAVLGEAAVGIGHINRLPDRDGISRWELLVLEYRNQFFPHFALAVAARAMGVPRERTQVVFGDGINLGAMHIPTDAQMRLLVNYYGPPKTFPHYSAFDVLNDKIATSAFQGKIVLVGATAPGIGDTEATTSS